MMSMQSILNHTSQYHFDPDARMQLRKSLEIENKFVVGVVGRMSEPKNPAFIISVCYRYRHNFNRMELRLPVQKKRVGLRSFLLFFHRRLTCCRKAGRWLK